MSKITRAKAIRTYEAICEENNLKRPRLHHYIKHYCKPIPSLWYLMEHGRKEIEKGNIESHSAEWTLSFISEREAEWKNIRRLAHS